MYPAIGAAQAAAQRNEQREMISFLGDPTIITPHSNIADDGFGEFRREGNNRLASRVVPFVEGQSLWVKADPNSTQSWDSGCDGGTRGTLIPLAFQKIDAPRGETGIFGDRFRNSMFLRLR